MSDRELKYVKLQAAGLVMCCVFSLQFNICSANSVILRSTIINYSALCYFSVAVR